MTLFPRADFVRNKLVSDPVQVALGVNAVQILAANSARRSLIVQNTGTTVIYLVLGAVDPAPGVYHVALRGGTGVDDGGGTIYAEDSWKGPVRAVSSGMGGRLVVMEING